jgi:hypothetical protein
MSQALNGIRVIDMVESFEPPDVGTDRFVTFVLAAMLGSHGYRWAKPG